MAGHERYRELAAASIDFELTPGESAALAAHLAACASCRAEIGALQADARALRRMTDGAPSLAVRERVLARGPRAAGGRPSPLLALAAAATLVLGLLGGLSAGAFLLATRQPATIPQPAWSRLAAVDGFPAGSGRSVVLAVANVAGLGSVHLVAIGTGGGDGRVWVSSDGERWVNAESTGLAAARPTAVAATAGRLIAVGNAVVGGNSVASAWTSSDARTWSATSFEGSTGLLAVVASPARIVVAGMARSGGGLPIWSSTDGARWSQGWQATSHGPANVTGLAIGGPGFVAVGYDDLGAVTWTSTDGLSWRRVVDPSFAASRMMAVAATPAGLVAVGGDAQGPLAWVSLDGVTWRRAGRLGKDDAWPTAVAATPFGVMAVGGSAGAARAWVSSDGRSWQPISNDTWTSAREIDGLAAHGSLVVIGGSSDGRAGVWLGRAPDGSG